MPAEGRLDDRRDRPGAEAESASGAAFAKKAESAAQSSAAPVQPTAKLGTAHGQRETSVVGSTSFTRQQPQPNEIIRIRYDSRENLVAAGIIREPVARTPAPDPFPDSSNASYVPDPPQRRY